MAFAGSGAGIVEALWDRSHPTPSTTSANPSIVAQCRFQ
jgi:hypothetical protein